MEYVSKFKNKNLRHLLSSVIGYRYNALSFIYTMGSFASGDCGYPAGGSIRMANNMLETYQQLGGKILFRTKAENIHIEDYEVSHFGRYYRLSDPFEKSEISAWMSVAKDKKKAIFTAVALSAHANDIPHFVKMRGLDPEACYTVKELQKEFTGASLMYGGLPLPYGREYRSVMYHLSCE